MKVLKMGGLVSLKACEIKLGIFREQKVQEKN